jgi:autotransporter-associated beta strand protein
MNKSILAVIRCSLMLLFPAVAYPNSAQWDLDPISGDWNTAANWTPTGVPNGPADIATFALSNTTDVSISANTEVNGITFTSAATSPYAITANPGLTLTISGVGITNNSGKTQHFVIAGDVYQKAGTLVFSNSATAGNNVSIFNQGFLQFSNRSTAGSSSILNEAGFMNFLNRSTAGSSSIFTQSGSMNFFNSSTAGNATIYTDGAGILFVDSSTAGSAYIGVTDNSFLQFANTSTAGNATIAGAGFIGFFDFSSAGSATIRSSGLFDFFGSSRGGTAQIELQSIPDLGYIGTLDISFHNAPGVTIGSLEGDEPANVFLGANNLTVGSNNLSTTFSGVIQDGGENGGTHGSLTKIGSGALILLGASTYTGDTNVNRGVLQVDGSTISNTSVNHRGTLAGIGTIQGNVMNNDLGIVRPGGALGAPGVLTVVQNYTQTQYATLMIQIAGTSAGEFSVLNVLGNANVNGLLDPVLLNGFIPSIGDEFTFLNYGSFSGAFKMQNGGIFNNGTERWVVTYQPTDAVLTATKNVPDQGSTFLLLTLGLLGLVTFRQKCWQ